MKKRGYFSLDELVGLVKKGLTIEHILPQEPTFDVRSYGFVGKDEYDANIDRLGNLALLESELNSKCNNQSVEKKMSKDELYKSSSYQMTVALAASHGAKPTAYNLDDINNRCESMANDCVHLWPLW
jgi:hypothetical protein